MNISIIGAGYVGLVTASCFAELGHNVTCIDVNKSKIKSLKNGNLPFFETGLSDLIIVNQNNGNLKFSCSYKKCFKNINVIFLCVDTPNYKNGKPNLSSIYKAARSIAKTISQDVVVVIKSTVPIGTSAKIQKYFDTLLSSRNIKVDLCSNPEFLREGSSVKDFMKPDRVIFGINSKNAGKLLKELYQPLRIPNSKIIFMSIESAELTKYASNSFLATKISFINEISQLADKSGANIHDIKKGMGKDPRIGNLFLNAGLGFGGSCFPKDLKALKNSQKSLNLSSGIISETINVNERQLNYFIKKITSYFGSSFFNSSIVVWGTAFKKGSDDLRESVAIKLINKISPKVKHLYIYDPVCKRKNILSELKNHTNITFINNKYTNLSKSDAIIICTDWDEFKNPDLNKIKKVCIFDGKNILNKKSLENAKIPYYGIGV
jgi:UDPglucose 6-dehydrogenase